QGWSAAEPVSAPLVLEPRRGDGEFRPSGAPDISIGSFPGVPLRSTPGYVRSPLRGCNEDCAPLATFGRPSGAAMKTAHPCSGAAMKKHLSATPPSLARRANRIIHPLAVNGLFGRAKTTRESQFHGFLSLEIPHPGWRLADRSNR